MRLFHARADQLDDAQLADAVWQSGSFLGGFGALLVGLALFAQWPGPRRRIAQVLQRAPYGLFFVYLPLIAASLVYVLLIINAPPLQPALWLFLGWALLGWLAAMLALPRYAPQIALIGLGVVLAFGVLEAGQRLVMRLFPKDVAPIVIPDETLGWRLRPNAEQLWSGNQPECYFFSETMQINDLGFYDADWPVDKPPDTLRIAVIGDSMIEAKQVSMDERATSLLQRDLNALGPLPNGEELAFEVLNFGVSFYGVGQYPLVYEAYARQFDPDYVLIYITYEQMLRTVSPGYPVSAFDENAADADQNLYIRPVYELDENGDLRLIPPDEDDLARLEAILQENFVDDDGELQPRYLYLARPLPVRESLWQAPYSHLLATSQLVRVLDTYLQGGSLWGRLYNRITPGGHPLPVIPWISYEQYLDWSSWEEQRALWTIHRQLLADFRETVEADGAELVVINDDGRYRFNAAIYYMARDLGLDHIAVETRYDPDDSAALAPGLHMPCDGHFNQAGNRYMADQLFEYFQQELTAPRSLYQDDDLNIFDQRNGEWHVYRYAGGQGLFVAAFRPAELDNTPQTYTAEDGWAVRLVPEEDTYRLELYSSEGELINDAFRFAPTTQ